MTKYLKDDVNIDWKEDEENKVQKLFYLRNNLQNIVYCEYFQDYRREALSYLQLSTEEVERMLQD